MERYLVWEGYMEGLQKKVNAIKNKCRKYNCPFHFEQVGEEIRGVPDYTTRHPISGKPIIRNCKFIAVEVEGTAVVNGWQFIASIEHTEKGNIYHKALTDVEIPERYRDCGPYCEHCNSKRYRKSSCIVMNTETGEFKQVGSSCLMDFTHGLSATFAAYLASLKTIFAEAEEEPIGFGGMAWGAKYFTTEEVLRYTAETIRLFGYSKSEHIGESTKDRMIDIFHVCHGDTRYMDDKYVDKIKSVIAEKGFDPNSEQAVKMTEDALDWLDKQEGLNDYMHNLKVVTSLEYTTYSRFGLLVSLFPTYNRELEAEARRKAEAEQGKASEYVGKEGDRVEVAVEAVKCLTSWESSYNGYTTTTTYVWKIVGKDGNIFTWKTSNWMNEDNPPASIKGTVKGHKEFRGVKQTELTRCRIERR